MANLGFLGLGIMGYPMARNLLQAGHKVALWSHTAEKAQKLASEHGGNACSSPAEVAAASDCIFLCVGDSEMSERLILGENGVANSLSPQPTQFSGSGTFNLVLRALGIVQ